MHSKKEPAITLRNIPEDVSRHIRRKADEEGISLNKATLELLQERLGTIKPKKRVYHDLDFLFGTWTKEEADAFDEAIKDQEKIDPELWDNVHL